MSEIQDNVRNILKYGLMFAETIETTGRQWEVEKVDEELVKAIETAVGNSSSVIEKQRICVVAARAGHAIGATKSVEKAREISDNLQ